MPAADEIIPTEDGMHAAREVSAARYFEVVLAEVPDLHEQDQAVLSRLE